jgi:hypothetical protein
LVRASATSLACFSRISVSLDIPVFPNSANKKAASRAADAWAPCQACLAGRSPDRQIQVQFAPDAQGSGAEITLATLGVAVVL